MFEGLTDKLNRVFKNLKGRGKLTEKDIDAVLKEIRMVLLEADVNFKVVKNFVASIRERAIGHEVLDSLTPAQQVIKIVKDEMESLLGGETAELDLGARPPVAILLAGLQGSGKTTTSAKLARLLKEERKKKVLLVPADTQRAAAITQLKKLGQDLSIEVFDSATDMTPLDICKQAMEHARVNTFDALLIDSAGRLQIDGPLMDELKAIKEATAPVETLFVADAMTGQEAVNIATQFDESIGITGVILTKLDGDARGGAALSIRAVTGKPIKFVGIGEKSDALETFHPDRMTSRILDMGDVLSLVEKAARAFDGEDTADLEDKLKKNNFDLEDFKKQLQMMKKVGSFDQILGMIPGMGKMKKMDLQPAEGEFKKIESIIDSMTRVERRKPSIINGSRRLRIAKGSGTQVQDVNKLLKKFQQAQKMMKSFSKMGMKGLKRGSMPFNF
ncbi:MAG: signal recognition particle protein [Deltaproteobacteria bacterium]|nr:signal recognition particle protein [Deltaproteobacteria bacterium]